MNVRGSVIRQSNLSIFGCFLLVVAALSATPLILFDAKAQIAGFSFTISGQGSTNTITCGTKSISTQSTTIVFSAFRGQFSGIWTITGSVYNPSTGLTTPFSQSGLINSEGTSANNNYRLTGGFLNPDNTPCGSGLDQPSPLGPGPNPRSVIISGTCGASVPINFKAVELAVSPGLPATTETATFTGNVVCT
jgi:hypothetical protein